MLISHIGKMWITERSCHMHWLFLSDYHCLT
jgi:hypothetical protein